MTREVTRNLIDIPSFVHAVSGRGLRCVACVPGIPRIARVPQVASIPSVGDIPRRGRGRGLGRAVGRGATPRRHRVWASLQLESHHVIVLTYRTDRSPHIDHNETSIAFDMYLKYMIYRIK